MRVSLPGQTDSLHDRVLSIARSMGLIDTYGQLRRVDSLMAVDLIVALEEELGLQIPVTALGAEAFASLDSLTLMLEQLATSQRGS